MLIFSSLRTLLLTFLSPLIFIETFASVIMLETTYEGSASLPATTPILESHPHLEEEDGVFIIQDFKDITAINIQGTQYYKLDLTDQNINLEKLEILAKYQSHITHLNLSENSLETRESIALLPFQALGSLILRENNFDDKGLEYVGQLIQLRALNIKRNEQITSKGIQALSPLTHLESLDASCIHLGNEGTRAIIATFPHLKTVDIHACGLTDGSILTDLLRMEHLKTLNIQSNPINSQELKSFLQAAKEKGLSVKSDVQA